MDGPKLHTPDNPGVTNVTKLFNLILLALYGPKLVAKVPGPVLPRASNPERYEVSPETIDDDVFTAVRMAWTIHTGQWGHDWQPHSAVYRMAHSHAPVALGSI